jgi:hypothetical protein
MQDAWPSLKRLSMKKLRLIEVRVKTYMPMQRWSRSTVSTGGVKGTATEPALTEINLECAIKLAASKYEKSENLNVCFEGAGLQSRR